MAADKAAGGREPRKEEHGQHVPPRPAGQTAAVGGCGGKVSNLAQGRALKGISESFPILAASLRYLPPHPPLKATHRLSRTARRTRWETHNGPYLPPCLALPRWRSGLRARQTAAAAEPNFRQEWTASVWLSHTRFLRQKWACQLGRLRPMRLRPLPRRNFRATCLSTGPNLDPLGYDICGALLARARRRLEALTGGVLTLQEAGCPAEPLAIIPPGRRRLVH